jgi:hypothetical protein
MSSSRATFRIAQQTNRSCRFAQVTLEITARSAPAEDPADVEVTADTFDEYRREAALGVRWALRSLPQPAKVTVTDIVTTEIESVTEARAWFEGHREGGDAESLVHAWLFFEHAVPVALHCLDEHLVLVHGKPYEPSDLPGFGETRVGPARSPDVLAGFAGSRLLGGDVLPSLEDESICGGLVLHFAHADLVIRADRDEWILEAEHPFA